jgi:hypothetical protein
MLAHRTPPSSVCANILSVVQLLVPNVTIVKELPGIRFVRYCRTVLAQVTQTLAAYEIALADAIQQSHTDGTSRRQTAMQNFVVRVLREGGSRRITLSSCILAEDESSASIAAAIIREFKHSGELLTQWRDATEKLYPDQQDLLKKFQRLLISQWPNWVLEASPQQTRVILPRSYAAFSTSTLSMLQKNKDIPNPKSRRTKPIAGSIFVMYGLARSARLSK